MISWITGLNDEKVIQELHQWIEKQRSAEISAKEVFSQRNRNLTKGFGLWANDAPFDETNYRDKIWQQEKNVW